MWKKSIALVTVFLILYVVCYQVLYHTDLGTAKLELNLYSTYEPGVVLYTDNLSDGYSFGGADGDCYVKRYSGKNLKYNIDEGKAGKIRIDFGTTSDSGSYIELNSMTLTTFTEKRVWSGTEIADLATCYFDYEQIGDSLRLVPTDGHNFLEYLDVKDVEASFNYLPLIIAGVLALCITLLAYIYFCFFRALSEKNTGRLIYDLILILLQGLFGTFFVLLYEHFAYGVVLEGDLGRNVMVVIGTFGIITFILCVCYAVVGKIGLVLGMLFVSILELANYYYMVLRGDWLCPWDFQSSEEAMKVVSFDSLKWSYSFLWLILTVLVALLLILPFFQKHNREKSFIRNFVVSKGIILAIGLALMGVLYSFIIKNNSYGLYQFAIDDAYSKNGFLIAFTYFLNNTGVVKPEGYNEATIASLEKEILAIEDKPDGSEEKPNIIVIMDEAFWDPSIFSDLQYEDDYLKDYYDILDESVHGYVLSPHFGGGTCDVEFEALTGFSMDFIQNGLMPYQGIVWKKDNFFSVVDYLKSQGYETTAMHPNTGSYYHRDICYAVFGFDRTVFVDEFSGSATRAWFLDDEYTFKKIIDVYEENKDSNNFIFAVTIQNHNPYGGEVYDEADVVNYVSSSDLSKEVMAPLQDFSNAVNLTSKALKEFVDYFRNEDRHTIILFWGDHMVNLGSSQYQLAYESNYLNDQNKEDADFLMYQTPFFVWDNYRDDLLDGESCTISTFQLLPTVFEKYDLPMPLYFHYLNNLKNTSTGRSHNSVILDGSGNPSEVTEEIIQNYKRMELLEYDYIYGEQYARDLFE